MGGGNVKYRLYSKLCDNGKNAAQLVGTKLVPLVHNGMNVSRNWHGMSDFRVQP